MKRTIVYFLFLLLGATSCCRDEEEKPVEGRTVLVYMVASNLGDYLETNIEDMIRAATAKNLNGGKLIVFYSGNASSAELFEIREGSGGVVTRFHIRDYENRSGVSSATLREVVNEVIGMYPNKSYGLIFSSHGTSWLPSEIGMGQRSFGEENGKNMEIYDLAAALPDHLFDFIIFDACSMASVECAYELRNKTDYLVASPSETMRYGFPHHLTIPYLFTEEADLENVIKNFYNFYRDEFGDGYQKYPYGNISITKTGELEALAAITKEIMAEAGDGAVFSPPYPDWQVLTSLRPAATKLYDFDDVIGRIATEERYARFAACLEKAVTGKYTTAETYSSYTGVIPVTHFSGLSIYPLQAPLNRLNAWYGQLEWYKAVYN
ncbi:MAG: hypothetical protein LBP50_09215 [Tannerella sp.]|jgi:hypothetical protein|nr:hypothetical protein [Tannerella sp.]